MGMYMYIWLAYKANKFGFTLFQSHILHLQLQVTVSQMYASGHRREVK